MKEKFWSGVELSYLLKLTSSSSDLSVSVSSSVNLRFSRLKVIVCKKNNICYVYIYMSRDVHVISNNVAF